MPQEEPVIVVAYDPAWPGMFRALGTRLRSSLGDIAVRIDHVGSTSVPGLDGKPVIDVQVSVESLERDGEIARRLASIGLQHHRDNPDRTKMFFLGSENGRRSHVHVRVRGSFDEQLNLLFRDYLRSHAEAVEGYARVKRGLAEKFRDDREGYVRAKEPTVWALLRQAHAWAQDSGWSPGPSDA